MDRCVGTTIVWWVFDFLSQQDLDTRQNSYYIGFVNSKPFVANCIVSAFFFQVFKKKQNAE